MGSKKNNHYVPVCYLKSWATGREIYTIPLENGLLRKQTPKEVAKRRNLYTVPDEFYASSGKQVTEPNRNVIEEVIFKTWEDRWPTALQLLRGDFRINEAVGIIKGFVITQSFRTPKFLEMNRKLAERGGLSFDDIPNFSHYGYLGSMGFVEYVKSCVCELIESKSLLNFITSDNPATHWIQNGESMFHLNGIATRTGILRNPNYKIVCPLNPRFLAILTPNLGLEIPERLKEIAFLRSVNDDLVMVYNSMIQQTADKYIFAKNIGDFR